MARALVTGSDDRVDAVAAALTADGVEVLTATDPGDLERLDLSAGIDHYVQLPVSVRPSGDNVVGRVRSFLSGGLLTRYALTERVLPALTDGASVVLVSGNTAVGGGLPDDQHSRLALLHVLAHATRAELAERKVRVSVVSGDRDDADLVRFARHGGVDPSTALAREPAEAITAKQYQDWRTEVMGMVTDHG